jgi:hypothetical protein
MIAGDPNVASAWSYHAMFHHGPRRPDPHDNLLSKGWGHSKSNPEYDGQ